MACRHHDVPAERHDRGVHARRACGLRNPAWATRKLLAPIAALGFAVAPATPSGATIDLSFFDHFAATVADGVPKPDLPPQPALTQLSRVSPADYADGVGAPAGADRPSARTLSNTLSRADNARIDGVPLTNLAVAMFQLLASHTHARSPTLPGPASRITIPLDADDPLADGSADAAITMQRSAHAGGAGSGEPRQQFNDVTPLMDGSSVYGSDSKTENSLRTLDGTGRMKIGPGGGLPVIDGRVAAGDVRRDENRLLEGVHALFVREHNRLADAIDGGCERSGRDCSGDQIFAAARHLVTLQQQKILYDELLPALLGGRDLESLAPDDVRDRVVGALNEYTAAAGRIGHTQVPDTIMLAKPDGTRRHVPLRDCFFDTACLGGAPLEDLLLGGALQPAEPVDTVVEDGLRNALIPGFGETLRTDLFTLNIMRGRDHGLGGYLDVRAALGLEPRPLSDLLPAFVLDAYPNADETGVDLIIGLFAEPRLPGAYLGETGAALWALQFMALSRDPAFYGQGNLAPAVADWLDGISMSAIMAASTGLTASEIPPNPFQLMPAPVPVPASLPLLGGGLALLGGLASWRKRSNRA